VVILLVDGEPVKFLNDVKVIVKTEDHEGHVTLTHEGYVMDLVSDGEIVETNSETWQESFDF
jgi:hydrogenase maturation factor